MQAALKTGITLLAGLGLGCGLTLATQWGHQEWGRRTKAAVNHPPALRSPLLIQAEPTLGSTNAPVTIVEFSDFQCPYCKRFHDEVFGPLKKHYIDKGLVRFVHKDLPLPFHEQSRPAAIAARCSAKEGGYWKTYQALFSRQNCLECQGAEAIAIQAGLDRDNLKQCLKQGKIDQIVSTNLSEAELHGIRATPTFVIGTSQKNQHSGDIIEGAMPWDRFKQVVDNALKSSRQVK